MEPELQPKATDAPADHAAESSSRAGDLAFSTISRIGGRDPREPESHGLGWVFMGSQGLRAGWAVLVFLIFFISLNVGIEAALLHFHLIGRTQQFVPQSAFWGESGALLSLMIAAALVALIERRSILAYHLAGPRRAQHFFSGLAAGFLALSVLILALAAGGWLHIGPVALSGGAILRYGLLWACVFLMGGCVEEGLFRCYGLFTLARGINFWWALGSVAFLCADLAMRSHGSAGWGVYVAAMLGLFPCLILHRMAALSTGFWCAAWVTSTLFGFVHVSNPGEAWIGIFAAAFIGFVLCVSVRLTGSAWWAIGCHAGWDWGETYFYGASDSGLPAHGRYLTSTPAGNSLWSGGSVGPEGSLLVVGVILLLLLALLLLYGRGRAQSTGEMMAPQPN